MSATVAKELAFIATMADRCAIAVAEHSRNLTGRMHIGTHAFRLGFDRLIEARSLFEAAARLEEANAPKE